MRATVRARPARGGPAELVLFGGPVLLMDAGSTARRCDAAAMVQGSWAAHPDPGSMCSAC